MARHRRLPGRHPADPAALAAVGLPGRGVRHLRAVWGLSGHVGRVRWERAGCWGGFDGVAAEVGGGEGGWGAAGLMG